MPLRNRAWKALLGFSLLLDAFALGFLLLGEFGGWYYDGRGGYQTSRYHYDRDEYDLVRQGTGSESWDSDGLFTEPALVAPLAIAALALAGALWAFGTLALRPDAPVRRHLVVAGGLAAIASLAIGIAAVLYAASMRSGEDWWFGSAFWAGFINSTVLAAIALVLARMPNLWPKRV